tara:strand:+ start:3894 stop:4922 length:1029 start_codon:yes stop_codon:yes gene_type:complete
VVQSKLNFSDSKCLFLLRKAYKCNNQQFIRMSTEVRDPGFGKIFDGNFSRLINKDGSFNVRVKGVRYSLRDAYVLMVGMKWIPFMMVLVGGYFFVNLIFAFIYLSIGIEQLTVEKSVSDWDNFVQAFFFSTQTCTTVGYGILAPKDNGASMVAALEAMMGFFMFSVATGLIYGRFSRPKPRFLFSEKMILAPYKDQQNALMFRVSNGRSNALMDLSVNVMLAMRTKDQHGWSLKYFRLKLETSRIHFLPLSWTIVHPIDEESPFYGLSPSAIEAMSGEVLVLFRAFDEGFGQLIHKRHSYILNDEFIIGAKFVRNFGPNEDGSIDLRNDHIGDYVKCELNPV